VPATPGPAPKGPEPLSNFASLPKGIDISSQGANWPWLAEHGRVRGDPLEFVILGTTVGTGTPFGFKQKWPLLRQSGLISGAYHFLHTSHLPGVEVEVPDPKDPAKKIKKKTFPVQRDRNVVIAHAEAQAKKYIEAVGSLDHALPPFLDIEWQPVAWDEKHRPTAYLDPRTHSANTVLAANTWIDRIRDAYKRDPIIYTNAKYWESLGNPNGFSGFRLWLSQYHNPVKLGASLPSGWSDWTLWQFAGDTSEVKGIFGVADLNVFNGSLEALELLGGTLHRRPAHLFPHQGP
jgi:GH25 family lysozyme M1 (1,4-beta-N-acetylmuramidase)